MTKEEKKAFNTALNKMAKVWAFDVLGEDQFKKNKDAANSIATDFKAGAKWCQSHLSDAKK